MKGQVQQAPRGAAAAAALNCRGGDAGDQGCVWGDSTVSPGVHREKTDKVRFLTSQLKAQYASQSTSMAALKLLFLLQLAGLTVLEIKHYKHKRNLHHCAGCRIPRSPEFPASPCFSCEGYGTGWRSGTLKPRIGTSGCPRWRLTVGKPPVPCSLPCGWK